MHLVREDVLAPFLSRDAVIGERETIGIETLQLRAQHPDDLWGKIENLLELGVLLSDPFLGQFALGDVGHCSDQLSMAGSILHDTRYRMHVLDASVRQQQAILVLEISAGLGRPISNGMDDARKQRAHDLLVAASRDATIAIDHARRGRNGDALKAWRALFGPKFPLS
jgi:hypothetical protein